MALTDFFRINMPYGMQKNEDGEWMVFNREYKPIGFCTNDNIAYKKLPIWVKYKALSEAKLLKIAHQYKGEPSIQKDENGKICRVWFYDDGSNPLYDPKHWKEYFEKIKIISQLKKATDYPT